MPRPEDEAQFRPDPDLHPTLFKNQSTPNGSAFRRQFNAQQASRGRASDTEVSRGVEGYELGELEDPSLTRSGIRLQERRGGIAFDEHSPVVQEALTEFFASNRIPRRTRPGNNRR